MASKFPNNWSLCIFCQADEKDERLVCPAQSKRTDIGAGYLTLSNDLKSFSEHDALPSHLVLDQSDDDQFYTEMLKNEASWHKTCRDNFNQTKLKRMIKRKSPDSIKTSNSLNIKRNRCKDIKNDVCVFCENVENNDAKLHEASTLNLDEKLRNAALSLGDSKLLSRLSAGDSIAIALKYHLKCLRMWGQVQMCQSKFEMYSTVCM